MTKNDSPPRVEGSSISLLSYLVSIYPSIREAFYTTKVKNETKQRTQASEDDDWRYAVLPSALQTRKKHQGLMKEELERLVRWKITHQTFRPFLLPQIRKNESTTVEKCTAEARQILGATTHLADSKDTYSPPKEDIRKALDKVCELKGVGPATGTLILSVIDSQNIPFFEDELYAWLFPQFAGKLKYTHKEYFELLDRFYKIRLHGVIDNQKSIKVAEAYEKIAFVCEHWDCLNQEEKSRAISLAQSDQEGEVHANEASKDHDERGAEPRKSNTSIGRGTAIGQVQSTGSKRRKVTENSESASLRRSKRQRI